MDNYLYIGLEKANKILYTAGCTFNEMKVLPEVELDSSLDTTAFYESGLFIREKWEQLAVNVFQAKFYIVSEGIIELYNEQQIANFELNISYLSSVLSELDKITVLAIKNNVFPC